MNLLDKQSPITPDKMNLTILTTSIGPVDLVFIFKMYISLKSHELLIILSSPWVLNTVKAKIKNSQNSKFAKK